MSDPTRTQKVDDTAAAPHVDAAGIDVESVYSPSYPGSTSWTKWGTAAG